MAVGERIKLEVASRQRTGSRESRRLRGRGLIPGILYGRGIDPQSISVPERDLRRALPGGPGLHAILDTLRLGDLAQREGVAFLDDPETVLATLTMPTRVEEPEEEVVEGEEGEEGVPEGEAAEGAAEGEGQPAAEQGDSGSGEE